MIPSQSIGAGRNEVQKRLILMSGWFWGDFLRQSDGSGVTSCLTEKPKAAPPPAVAVTRAPTGPSCPAPAPQQRPGRQQYRIVGWQLGTRLGSWLPSKSPPLGEGWLKGTQVAPVSDFVQKQPQGPVSRASDLVSPQFLTSETSSGLEASGASAAPGASDLWPPTPVLRFT